MKRHIYTMRLIVFVVCAVVFGVSYAYAATTPATVVAPTAPEILRNLIDLKSQELKKVQDERNAVQKSIEVVTQAKNSLLKDIKTIDYNVNQLDLSIKANKLTLEKIALEMQSLDEDLDNTQVMIQHKKETVGKLLVALQEKEHENLFQLLLKNKSLAASVSEIQNIGLLNRNLIASVGDLRDLQVKLSNTIQVQQQKKVQRQQEQASLVGRQYIIQDQKAEKTKLLSVTQDQEKIYQQQIANIEQKQEEIGQFIEEIEDQLRASFDPSLLPVKRPGVLAFPVLEPRVTQLYGRTKYAQRAYRTGFHNGVDFGASVGTPVVAVADGKVVAVDNNDRGTSRWNKYQYGKYIVLEHPNNLSTLYAHLSRFAAQEGDSVKKGDIIGYAGNTGYADGAHVHLTVFWAPSVQYKAVPPAAGLVPVGVTIDPKDYLPNF